MVKKQTKKVKEKKVKEVKSAEPVEQVIEPVEPVELAELTPREKAWEHFKNTMKKYNPKKFEKMMANGELDKMPDKFTF